MSCKAPLSWLLLEQHSLGELKGVERDRVAAHLAECEDCRASLARIEKDDRALPPLPARTTKRNVIRFPVAPLAAALALAAGLVLWMRLRPDELTATRVKGDAVALALVTNDDGVLEAGVYRNGDVLKAIVTCPPSLSGAGWDLVVFDPQGASFPLRPTQLACGNAVSIPGAFRLTGRAPQDVCVVWNEGGPVDRGSLTRDARDHRTCIRLEPSD